MDGTQPTKPPYINTATRIPEGTPITASAAANGPGANQNAGWGILRCQADVAATCVSAQRVTRRPDTSPDKPSAVHRFRSTPGHWCNMRKQRQIGSPASGTIGWVATPLDRL